MNCWHNTVTFIRDFSEHYSLAEMLLTEVLLRMLWRRPKTQLDGDSAYIQMIVIYTKNVYNRQGLTFYCSVIMAPSLT
jgi:hypothetical protein